MATTYSVEHSAAQEIEQLRQQVLRLQKLSQIGLLTSSITHEFNNLLTTIINFAKLGLQADSEAERRDALQRILKAGQRGSTICNSLLGLLRQETVRREMTDLVALVEEVLTLVEKDLQRHQIRLEKDYQGRPRAPVVVGQIQQLLLNLITNARQAMPRGGRLRITVRENPETDMVEIAVHDTGVGIAADKLRLIFEPFYTTKSADEREPSGTGLGLTICRQIIEAHQGRIRVESLVGRGTTFTVKLPRRSSLGNPSAIAGAESGAN
ncbi:MAG: ATP-binding protein [Gemmatales bacterium]|nr:ATP-binding protein [Gemmatales bacterium]MCS7160487.1 ATP-binding protein [Gemmatales bacterium]MDW8175688.1 ATP-binding protein [Gemmatales bacterium]MDW8222376.1 ATP-binding protein [Gemmatales bacterium]